MDNQIPGNGTQKHVKEIRTLIPDIYDLVQKKDGWFSDEAAYQFGHNVSRSVQASLGGAKRSSRLSLSQMGPRCPKALWHRCNTPHLATKPPPWAEVKFAYGHILEALVISLAKASGHEVVGEQDELEVDGILGHRDCVIDGHVVDVKSSSSRGFIKFKDGSLWQNDSFGYLDQLDGYLLGGREDPLIRIKDVGYLLAIDKQLGHMVLYEHTLRETRIRERVRDYKAIVALDRPPQCTCEQVPYGKSGNIALGVNPSYSEFKFECHPHLRTFLYASGPVYLTKVVKVPDVPEVDKYGTIVPAVGPISVGTSSEVREPHFGFH